MPNKDVGTVYGGVNKGQIIMTLKNAFGEREDITQLLGDKTLEDVIGQRDLSTTDKKIRATAWFIIVILVGWILCNEIVKMEVASSQQVKAFHYLTIKK